MNTGLSEEDQAQLLDVYRDGAASSSGLCHGLHTRAARATLPCVVDYQPGHSRAPAHVEEVRGVRARSIDSRLRATGGKLCRGVAEQTSNAPLAGPQVAAQILSGILSHPVVRLAMLTLADHARESMTRRTRQFPPVTTGARSQLEVPGTLGPLCAGAHGVAGENGTGESCDIENAETTASIAIAWQNPASRARAPRQSAQRVRVVKDLDDLHSALLTLCFTPSDDGVESSRAVQ